MPTSPDHPDEHGAPTERGRAAAALTRLVVAARAGHLYGQTHPAARQRVHDAKEAFGMLPTRLLLGVVAARLTLGGEPLGDEPELAGLGAVLDRANVASIEIAPTGEDSHVGAAASILGTLLHEPTPPADLAARVAEASHGVVRFTMVDYARLRMTGAGDGPGIAMTDLLAATLAGGSDADVVSLATQVNAGGTSLHADDLARVLREAAPDEVGKARSRVGRFVAALDPKARRHLVALDPKCGPGSMRTLRDLADVLPVNEVLDALDRSEIASHALTPESIMLLAKLATIASHDRALGDRVRRSAEACRHAPNSPEELRRALDELLRIATAKGISPEAYEKRLTSLSLNYAAPASAFRGANEVTPEQVRDHRAVIAAEIAVQSTDMSEEAVRVLVESVDAMISRGRLGLLAEAVRATQAFPFGGDLRAAVLTPERLERIARAGAADTSQVAGACALLEHAGPAGAAWALRTLGAHPDSSVRRQAAELVRRHADQPAALQAHLKAHDAEASVALASLADLLPPTMIAGMLEARLTDVGEPARSETLLRLGRRARCWTRPLIMLALGSPNPEVAGLALERLDSLDETARLEVLRAYIEGAYGMPHASVVEAAAAGMIACGMAGRHAAADALFAMSLKPRASAAHAAQAIAGVLREGPQDAPVRRALRAWSIMPTRWLGFLGRKEAPR